MIADVVLWMLLTTLATVAVLLFRAHRKLYGRDDGTSGQL